MHGIMDRVGPNVEGGFNLFADERKRGDDGYGDQAANKSILDGGNAIVLLNERLQPDQSISVY